ncbi:uncharacterized protein MELLADRAFT_64598 [Melampsora larici-populina 98AG31]|uniref:Uncharacterized protein n=1 Tax=Melampsora larici-populina (strain 98AG31 / pathotype 3-4-7) TaxID=747676 RepID=F4RS18_MELLP|nr:uncharacterized protein MELLADRAFT_64598 [Melampsora larici-populina 98AG31]EGG04777.1 hypothetical protein MELLADRAFT_64598 [Melampsora larici-populina 98AG31]
MHSQSSSPSLIQGSFVPLDDETTFEPMCVTRLEYNVPSMRDQAVLRLAFRPMPFRHRVEEVRPIRQRDTSVSQLISMFDHLIDEEMVCESDASTSPDIGSIARSLTYKSSSGPDTYAPFFSNNSEQDNLMTESTSRAFSHTHNADSNSPSRSSVAPFPIPHHMIDWTVDVNLDASSLPKWENPQVDRSTTANNTYVEENCQETKRRKLPSECRQLVFVPRHSSPTSSHTAGEDEPRKRRKRCNES